MPTPKNRLTITGLDEISFVPDGDNPPALIKLCKAKPPISNEAPMADNAEQEDTYVAKEVVVALQKRLAELEESSAIEKVKAESDVLIQKICGPIKDIDLPSVLRDIDRKAPESGQHLRKILNILGERIQKGGLGKIGSTVPGGMSAAEQFEKVVQDIAKAKPGMSKNDALLQAASLRPDLYESARRGE
jgi:hypothetical protein